MKTIRVNSIYVEPAFFEIFGFNLATGSLQTEPNSLVLSHEMAEKFFNEINPVGKFLTHPTYGAFKITGVLKPFKKQTQFRSEVMVSMASYTSRNQNATQPQASYKAYTFVKLQVNAQPNSLDLALNEIAKKSDENIISAKKTNQFRKQALKDISPNLEKLRFNPYVEDLADIIFNFGIPLMILVLAGFNYTNLTLARSLSRSKEVGVRKVMGAVRHQLIFQFICEAVVIALFALFVGVMETNYSCAMGNVVGRKSNNYLAYFYSIYAIIGCFGRCITRFDIIRSSNCKCTERHPYTRIFWQDKFS